MYVYNTSWSSCPAGSVARSVSLVVKRLSMSLSNGDRGVSGRSSSYP